MEADRRVSLLFFDTKYEITALQIFRYKRHLHL